MNAPLYTVPSHRSDGKPIGIQPLLTNATLKRQNRIFRKTGGVSAGNRCCGFAPAFLDRETGAVYLARFADGRPAPMHLLDGLPPELVVKRSISGGVAAVKESVVAGFVRSDRFYTREQAAAVAGG